MSRSGFEPSGHDDRGPAVERRAPDPGAGDGYGYGTGEAPAGEAQAGWVSVADAAEAAGVSTSTIRYWYRHGSIPTQRAEGEGGRYLVPLDAVLARANRLGDDGEPDDDELDMDAVYWSAECEKARKEADRLRGELAEATSRVAALEARVRALEEELDSLEIIDDDLHDLDDLDDPDDERDGDRSGPAAGYRGPVRPQDPHRVLRFEGERLEGERLEGEGDTAGATQELPALPAGGDGAAGGPGAPDDEPAFAHDPSVFEDDVLPAPEKKRRR